MLLQIVICLECMGIAKCNKTPLPQKQLIRSKSKKKPKLLDMNAEFKAAINTLCDRLIISNVDDANSKTWPKFFNEIVSSL